MNTNTDLFPIYIQCILCPSRSSNEFLTAEKLHIHNETFHNLQTPTSANNNNNLFIQCILCNQLFPTVIDLQVHTNNLHAKYSTDTNKWIFPRLVSNNNHNLRCLLCKSFGCSNPLELEEHCNNIHSNSS
jgi:hypothetical protein